jgi:hypothetical protein
MSGDQHTSERPPEPGEVDGTKAVLWFVVLLTATLLAMVIGHLATSG